MLVLLMTESLTIKMRIFSGDSSSSTEWPATLLPFLPQPRTAGATKATHDAFNVAVMPLLLLMSAVALWEDPVLAVTYDPVAPPAWQPWVLVAYFAVDTVWIAWDCRAVRRFVHTNWKEWMDRCSPPACVCSPGEILWHHAAVLGMLGVCLSVPALTRGWIVGTLVEVNTVFLIGQRLLSTDTPAGKVARALTLITWIPARFGVPAWLWLTLLRAWLWDGAVSDPVGVLSSAVLLFLSGLQVLWTIRLLASSAVAELLAKLQPSPVMGDGL